MERKRQLKNPSTNRLVVFVAGTTYGSHGGVQTFLRSYTSWLQKRDIQALSIWVHPNPLSFTYIEHPDLTINSSNRERVMFNTAPYLLFFVHRIVFAFLSAVRLVTLSRPVYVLHAQNPFAGLACWFASGIKGVPFVLSIHGPRWTPLWSHDSMHKMLLLSLCKFVMKKADCIITVDKQTLKGVLSLSIARSKIVVIPPAIDVTELQKIEDRRTVLDNRENTVDVVYLGRLSKEKRVDWLVKAFGEIIKEKDCKAKLHIVGDGNERQAIERVVSELSLNDSVVFYGATSLSVARQMLKKMDILVLPSRPDAEGVPLSLLEGMASGVTILATNSPSIKAIIRHEQDGLLFNSMDVDSLTHYLRKLITHAQLREKLAKMAMIKVSKFDVDNIYPQILNVYQSMRAHKKSFTALRSLNKIFGLSYNGSGPEADSGRRDE